MTAVDPATPGPSSPSAPAPPPHPDELPPTHRTIRLLSDRLVEAQRPFRILDACKWTDDVEHAFFESRCEELPRVDRAYYETRPLAFDPDEKRAEFYDLERDIRRELGTLNACGNLMTRACKEYRVVVDMLEKRGTPAFSAIAQGLYGSTFDRFHAGDPTLGELGQELTATLVRLDRLSDLQEDERDLDAEQSRAFLQGRMDRYFGGGVVDVKISDGILADAAAGGTYVKLRADAHFSVRDLEVLEVHEGWVHIGTTLNGMAQPVCTFLSKGTPSCTVTQEGLAVVQEIFTFKSMPARIERLADRVDCVRMAEEGADFLQVFHSLVERGRDPKAAYQTAQRAFRGSLPAGCGPFTKDLSYNRGFIQIYNLVRLAVNQGLASRLPLLFLGKLRIADIGELAHLVDEGFVIPPHYLPHPYTDLRGLAAWMCYSRFLNAIDLDRASADYASLLRGTSAPSEE